MLKKAVDTIKPAEQSGQQDFVKHFAEREDEALGTAGFIPMLLEANWVDRCN